MRPFRFSPIKNKKELLKAITYVHFSCFKLGKQILGKYLPNAGNIGIFCHYEDEFKYLTKVREELTILSDSIYNNKYYRLLEPIVIPAKGDIPETTYTYLYIRRPETAHPNVGDVDFYLEPQVYKKLKDSLLKGKKIKGATIFDRPDLDLIKLFNTKIDVSSFVGANKFI